MKIITMKRLTENKEPLVDDDYTQCDPNDWFCVIETPEEEMVYDDFVEHLGQYSGDPRDLLWNKMVIHAGQGMGVSWGDDDMYGYIRPDEVAPLPTEPFIDGDGDEWVVIN